MSHWHPPIENAAQWRAHYERWRDIHGPSTVIARRLRRLSAIASRDNSVQTGQRNELLGLFTQIDAEKRAR